MREREREEGRKSEAEHKSRMRMGKKETMMERRRRTTL